MGEGATFQEHKITMVDCEEFRGEMLASSLRHHMESTH